GRVPDALPGDGEPVGGGGVRLLRGLLRGGGDRHRGPGRPGGGRAPDGDAGAPHRGRRVGGVAARERFERMREAVRAVMAPNRQRGHAGWCGYDYDFVCPSMGTYPFQWFWDSCFHTVALAHFDRERARSEVRSLLRNAQPDGFVAHVTFWQ